MAKSLRDEVEALAVRLKHASFATTVDASRVGMASQAEDIALELRAILARHPPADGVAVPDGYYIQDSRGYVGNCMLFWGPNRSGYTTNIDEAGVYSRADAEQQHRSRATDIAWPAAYIRSHAKPSVDFQYVNQADAILAQRAEG